MLESPIKYWTEERMYNNNIIDRTENIIMEMIRYNVDCNDQLAYREALINRNYKITEEIKIINDER